jgi:galactose-1-phosphate uridylyltransferase
MENNLKKIRVFVASPHDVEPERQKVKNIIENLNTVYSGRKIYIEFVGWEIFIPGMGRPQEVINNQIGEFDIFIGIMWKWFGKPTGVAESGTEEEFRIAYKKWEQDKNNKKITFYFCQKPFMPKTPTEVEQLGKVIAFKNELEQLGLISTFISLDDFSDIVGRHIAQIIEELSIIDLPVYDKSKIKPEEIEFTEIDKIRVQNTEKYSSFQPQKNPQFYRVVISTTPGRDKNNKKLGNKVFITRDPVRPFEIQIGLTRRFRNEGEPEAIDHLKSIGIDKIKRMYPFILEEEDEWIRMVLAELVTDSVVIDHIHTHDPSAIVKKIAAKNPSASEELKQANCKFCDPDFKFNRKLPFVTTDDITVMPNDFPYGAFFHYLTFPNTPVHSWEDVKEEHLLGMNLQIWKHLNSEFENNKLNGAAGVLIGLNSTIKHLVLGKKTRTSAGASIEHVHKQIWGFAKGAFNIGDHLSSICKSYNNIKLDYLDLYLKAIHDGGYVIWKDDNVALYIPFGQIAIHELQVMFLRKNAYNFISLTEDEIVSLSHCEYIVTKIYKKIEIHSFNEIIISEPFDTKTDNFRSIISFITREVDYAVSELNLLYVVDKYPEDTLDLVISALPDVKRELSLESNGIVNNFML